MFNFSDIRDASFWNQKDCWSNGMTLRVSGRNSRSGKGAGKMKFPCPTDPLFGQSPLAPLFQKGGIHPF